MGEIRILDETTVNQIAAGEVIERPASVVKELVENSLDAEADEIDVSVKKGGKELIRVKDNGEGMSRDEVELAFKKHATSKISDIEDLDELSSLGFRGEALPSIAAVSKVEVHTKVDGVVEGTKIIIEGGDIKNIEETGCPVGTTIEVKDLFYNTPARKKYLKKTNTELAHISDVVTRNALLRQDVKFSLSHNDNELFTVPKSLSRLENIKSIYDTDVAKKMVEVDESDEYIQVKGYVSKPDITRSTRKHIFCYVNDRYVKNNLLRDAIVEGYGTLLTKHRYPIVVLDIDISGREIDVNVHPTKTKIRFIHEEKVKRKIVDFVRSSLLKEDLVPEQEEVEPADQGEASKRDEEPGVGVKAEDEESIRNHGEQTTLSIEEQKQVKTSKFGEMKIIGLIKDSYIVAETKDGFAMIDQHAAHERINYEFLEDKYEDEIGSQSLMSPKNIELKPREAAVLRANDGLLKRLGFRFEHFGKTTFRLTGLPVVLGEVQEDEILHDVLDELMELKGSSLDERKGEMIEYMACHSSVRAGDMLSITSASDILNELGKTENPYTCPHGRPTIVRFTEKEIKKWFKRT